MTVMALSSFAQTSQFYVETAKNQKSHCYQARLVEYGDYLERKFDEINNSTSPLAQIYISSQANNEYNNLKEMLKEPDRNLLIEAMNKEVSSLFKEETWKLYQRVKCSNIIHSKEKKTKKLREREL